MGLQVWLPLINGIENQGLNGAIAPQLMGSGVTFTNGKIGNAATFPNNCNSCIYMDGLKLQTGSWCTWIKVLGEGSGASQRIISEGRDTGSVGTNIFVNKAGTTLTAHTHKRALQTTISLNTWYHVAITFGNGIFSLYINGNLLSSISYTEDSDYAQSNDKLVLGKMSYSYTSTNNYFPLNGQLNDVRIYDHCLSPREVKEISKGLVLHYPLAMPGQENLLQGSRMNKDTTKNWEWYGVNNTINRKFDNDAYYFETNNTGTVNNSYCMRVDRNAIGVQVGDTLTVSMDIRGTIAGESYLQIMSTTPSSTNFWAYSTRGTNPCSFGNTIKEDVFQRYSLTFTLPESHSTNTYFYIFPSIGFNSHIWYRNVKLERGSIATPWMPKIIGQDNLFDFEPIASNWAAESCTVANYFDSKWGNALQVTTTQANQRIYRNVSNVWEADTVYTVSFLAKASTPIQCNMSRSIADFSPTFNLNTEWRRYTGIINSTQTVSGGTLSFRLLTAGTVYITNITLEKGDTTLTYDGFDNTEYDVSGYEYNGIKIGTITYDSDTPRYNTSAVFNGIDSYIKMPTMTLDMGDVTFSVWAKWDVFNNWSRAWDFGISTNGSAYDLCLANQNSTSNIMIAGRGPGGTPTLDTKIATVNAEKWNHFVIVMNGSICNAYVNGALSITWSIGGGNPGVVTLNNCFLGKSNWNADKLLSGGLLDFRIYTTALSADDVLELYHTLISLSNNGTLLTQGEYVES